MFHVSMLRKYIFDSSHVLEAPTIKFKENLSFEMHSVAIVKEKLKKLRNNVIPKVKVLWKSDTIE